MTYQMMLKGMELKRDLEFNLLSNVKYVTGDSTTPRKFATVLSYLKSNTSSAGGVGNPSASDGTDTRTDGTQRAFTEAQLKTVLSSCWSNGGKPDTVMTGAFNKQQFSTFTGRGTPMQDQADRKITAAVDVYESDFGKLKVIANRFQRSRDVLVLQMEMFAYAPLPNRNFITFDLAKTGDTDKKQLLVEATLEVRNEKSSGGVFDLTSS